MGNGFYFDMTACIGCRTCQVACKDKNDLEMGVIFRRLSDFEVGEYPAVQTYHYSGSCNHCEKPECVAACPTLPCTSTRKTARCSTTTRSASAASTA